MAECKTITKPELKYCSLHTEKHPILCRYKNVSDCFVPLSELFSVEGYTKSTCKDLVYSLDKIEAELAKRENKRSQRATVDCCFVAAKGDRGKKLILVECKFKSKNILKECEDIDAKITRSLEICTYECDIHKPFYILFADKIYQQAKSRVNRKIKGGELPKDITIMTAPMFCEQFFA